ncbi:hypothetical protein BJX65DRAFT_294636 [Aspergillus insuetus]
MTHHLPPELWVHIAIYLEEERSSLAKCVRVCCQWQTIFERLLYRKVKVESEEFQTEDGFISLAPRLWRTRYGNLLIVTWSIQSYYHTIFLTTERRSLRDIVSKTHSEPRITRLFRLACCHDLSFFKSWKQDATITLVLEVLGRVRMLEPETKANQHAKEWQGELRGERVVAPYRAQFPSGDALMLTEVTCVEHLIVPYSYRLQGVATGASLQIAERCAALRRLHLVMPGQQALASGLPRLPSTLQVFECVGRSEHPWSNTLPALDLRSAKGINVLSSSLRLFSCNLRELRLRLMSIDMDFLFPLDKRGSPLPKLSSLHWPHLETIALDSVAEYTPFEYEISSEKMNTEHFHRLFISLGYAARRMPVLRLIMFSIPGSPGTKFTFNTTSGVPGMVQACLASTPSLPSSSRPVLNFRSDSAYRSDRRVADAWGFELDEMEVVDEGPQEDYHLVEC